MGITIQPIFQTLIDRLNTFDMIVSSVSIYSFQTLIDRLNTNVTDDILRLD